MTFEELLLQVEARECKEKRDREKDYLEVVVAKAVLAPVSSALGEYFGPPRKPEGVKPTTDDSRRAAPYGGIYEGQTMYYREGEEGPELALLWPWGSEPNVTVKIIRGEKLDP